MQALGVSWQQMSNQVSGWENLAEAVCGEGEEAVCDADEMEQSLRELNPGANAPAAANSAGLGGLVRNGFCNLVSEDYCTALVNTNEEFELALFLRTHEGPITVDARLQQALDNRIQAETTVEEPPVPQPQPEPQPQPQPEPTPNRVERPPARRPQRDGGARRTGRPTDPQPVQPRAVNVTLAQGSYQAGDVRRIRVRIPQAAGNFITENYRVSVSGGVDVYSGGIQEVSATEIIVPVDLSEVEPGTYRIRVNFTRDEAAQEQYPTLRSASFRVQ